MKKNNTLFSSFNGGTIPKKVNSEYICFANKEVTIDSLSFEKISLGFKIDTKKLKERFYIQDCYNPDKKFFDEEGYGEFLKVFYIQIYLNNKFNGLLLANTHLFNFFYKDEFYINVFNPSKHSLTVNKNDEIAFLIFNNQKISFK